MKRDWELCRKILLDVEECQDMPLDVYPISIDGYTKEQVGFHVYLLGQAGLLEVTDGWATMNDPLNYHPLGITWEGYEFLSKVKNEVVWKKAVGVFYDKGLPIALDLLKGELTEIMRNSLV